VAGVSFLLNSTVENTRREFNPSLHISREKLRIAVGDWPLFIGLSYGDGVVASVIGQIYNREIRIFAAFVTEGASLKHHLSEYSKSWLAVNVRTRLRIMGGYENTADLQLQSETYQAVQDTLGGEWTSISKSWELRRDSLRDTLTKAQPFTFRPILQFDSAGTIPLSQALSARSYEKAGQADKKSYYLVNSLSLLLARLELWKAMPKKPGPHRMPPSAWSA
jgi:hypothetical protein